MNPTAKKKEEEILNGKLENQRQGLDTKLFTGAVFMNLSKIFDCIPRDLLIAKLQAYGLEFDCYFSLHLLKRTKTKDINQ